MNKNVYILKESLYGYPKGTFVKINQLDGAFYQTRVLLMTDRGLSWEISKKELSPTITSVLESCCRSLNKKEENLLKLMEMK